jgi:predicted membrane protein
MSKKNLNSILWGIALIAIAVFLVLKQFVKISSLGLNWWALFIVVPCIMSLISDKFSFISLGGLLIGAIFFFEDPLTKLITFDASSLILPIVLVMFGLHLMIKLPAKKEKKVKIDIEIDNDTEEYNN